ncbi:MAG: energy transducer TonB [Bacteroidia bacterium]
MTQVITASLDEMVFEGREKDYGAFSLRKSYPHHLLAGTTVIGITAFLLTFGPLIAKSMGFYQVVPYEKEKIAIVINPFEIPQPPAIDEETPELPPPPRIEKDLRTLAYLIPEPTPEEDLDDDEASIVLIDSLKDVPNIGLIDKAGADEIAFFPGELDGTGSIPEVIVEREVPIDVFIVADEEPQPVNMSEVQKLIGYPQIARDAGIQGSVIVRVLVDKKGNYTKHKVINQVHPILEKAVTDHIDKLQFTPAIQGKKPIQFWVNIPFNFKLL